ncbi:MAG: DUF885 domain-containing protein [Acidobacteria bacterium]|nr:DUF885 domain-containing protein [Acidobacteriota bacterium]
MNRVLFLLALPLAAQDRVAQLETLYKEYFEFTLKESPEQATSAGRTEYNHRWGDRSPAAIERRRAALKGFLERAEGHAPASLPAEARMNQRLFVYQLKAALNGLNIGSYYFAASHYGGLVRSIDGTLDSAPARTPKDFEDRIARLRGVPALVDGLIASADAGLKKKMQVPRLSVNLAAGIYESMAAPAAGTSPLLKAFREMPPSIPEAARTDLRERAETAYREATQPALKKLAGYLRGTYAPATRTSVGLSANFNGTEMYQVLIEASTTTKMTARQIHDTGVREMARIGEAMAAIRKSLGFTGTAAEFDERVLQAPAMRFKSAEEILAHGREIAKRVDPMLPKMFLKLPRMPYGVEAIPDAIARTAAPHYRPPALDGSRAGYFYLRTVDPETQSRCCMAALILHEAVPGHHLQLALAREMENMPSFRLTAGYSAFAEGWGLYAESLGEDLGMYRNPHEMYGRLQSEMFRAARLVVDTGVHAFGWSREQMIAAMAPAKGGWINDAFLSSEVDRYIAMPAQALAYKIGGLKIEELRRRAEKALGSKFDLRVFHDVVLRNGSIPLDILEEEVDAWIASRR